MAPSGGPLETAGLQEKSHKTPGVRALWGQQWTRLPFFSSREVLPQRGHGRPITTATAIAVEWRATDGIPDFQETTDLQEKRFSGF